MEYLNTKNCKTQLREINRPKINLKLYHVHESEDTVLLLILPKLMYRIDVIPIKIPGDFFFFLKKLIR